MRQQLGNYVELREFCVMQIYILIGMIQLRGKNVTLWDRMLIIA